MFLKKQKVPGLSVLTLEIFSWKYSAGDIQLETDRTGDGDYYFDIVDIAADDDTSFIEKLLCFGSRWDKTRASAHSL